MKVQDLQKWDFKSFSSGNNVCKVSVIKDNIWHVLFVILVLKLTSKTKAKGCYKIEYAGNNSQKNFLSNYISSTNKIEEYICIITTVLHTYYYNKEKSHYYYQLKHFSCAILRRVKTMKIVLWAVVAQFTQRLWHNLVQQMISLMLQPHLLHQTFRRHNHRRTTWRILRLLPVQIILLIKNFDDWIFSIHIHVQGVQHLKYIRDTSKSNAK